jgi:hypothetical protein
MVLETRMLTRQEIEERTAETSAQIRGRTNGG